MSDLALTRALPGMQKRNYDGHYMDVGKNAEKVVMEWLSNNPYVIGVNDLRSLREMREADVDCSLQLSDGRVVLAEIKSDYHLGVSGNVLFEMLRINHTSPPDRAVTLGWSGRSPAKWLLFYAPQSDSLYKCEFTELRRAFQKYTSESRKNTRIDYVVTDAIKSTVNALIPFEYCKFIFTVYKGISQKDITEPPF